MHLKPVRVHLCADEVERFLHRKQERPVCSKPFCPLKDVGREKYYEYDPNSKEKTHHFANAVCRYSSVECLSRKYRGEEFPKQITSQAFRKLITKLNPGVDGRNRRKVVTPEESSEMGEGNICSLNKEPKGDDGMVKYDRNETILVEDEVTEHADVREEVQEQNVVGRDDWFVVEYENAEEPDQEEDEDKIVVKGENNKQLVVHEADEDQDVEDGEDNEQLVVHKANEDQDGEEGEDNKQLVVHDADEDQIVVKGEDNEQLVVHEADEDQIVVKGEDNEQLVVHEADEEEVVEDGEDNEQTNSHSLGRCSVEDTPAMVIVKSPNKVTISESETRSDREGCYTDIRLKPVKIHICADEVERFLQRKQEGPFCHLEKFRREKYYEYEPAYKRRKVRKPTYKPFKPKVVSLYPSEALECISRKREAIQFLAQNNTQRFQKLIKNLNPGVDGRNRRRVMTPEDSSEMGEGNICALNKEPKGDDGKVKYDRNETILVEDEVTEHADVREEVQEQNVLGEDDLFVVELENAEEPDQEEDEDPIVVKGENNKQLVVHKANEDQDGEEGDDNKQLVVHDADKDQIVVKGEDNEQLVVHKAGEDQDVEDGEDNKQLVVHKANEDQDGEEGEDNKQLVVHDADEDQIVVKGEDNEQLVVHEADEEEVVKDGEDNEQTNSHSLGRCSVEDTPAMVILKSPNKVTISESETRSDREGCYTDIRLKPVKVHICADEAERFLQRKQEGTFCQLEEFRREKYFGYEPAYKRRNVRKPTYKPFKPKVVSLYPSEALECISRKKGRTQGLAHETTQGYRKLIKNANPRKRRVVTPEESSGMGEGKLNQRVDRRKRRKVVTPEESSEMGEGKLNQRVDRRKRRKVVTPEESSEMGEGKLNQRVDRRKRRKVVTPEESSEMGKGNICALNKKPKGDDGMVKYDRNETILVEDEVTEHADVREEVQEQNVLGEDDWFVVEYENAEEPDQEEDEDKIVVKRENEEKLVVHDAYEDQIVVKWEDNEQLVVHEDDEDQIVVKGDNEEQFVVKEEVEQNVVHMEEDWIAVLQEYKDKLVVEGEAEEQLVVKKEEEEEDVIKERVEQIMVHEEVEDCIVVEQETKRQIVREQGVEHFVVHEEEEDCIVVEQESKEQIAIKKGVEHFVVLEEVEDCIVLGQEGQERNVVKKRLKRKVVIIDD